MDANELIKKVEELEVVLGDNSDQWSYNVCHSFFITTIQFVKTYIGKDSEFYRTLNEHSSDKYIGSETDKAWAAKRVLKALKDYLKLNLNLHRTDQYTIKVGIISDFLLQAIELSGDKKFHPAAAAILMGAALEEFLKELAYEKEIELSGIKLTIDPISKKLYDENVITKQDLKDITAWAGIRNDATHGNFEAVNDRKRIQNAIEGVNLFMRKYKL